MIVSGTRVVRVVGGGHIQKFAVGFVLDDAVDISVGGIIPHALGFKFHGETVTAAFIVGEGVGGIVAAAAYGAADQTDPEIGVRAAYDALVEARFAMFTRIVALRPFME